MPNRKNLHETLPEQIGELIDPNTIDEDYLRLLSVETRAVQQPGVSQILVVNSVHPDGLMQSPSLRRKVAEEGYRFFDQEVADNFADLRGRRQGLVIGTVPLQVVMSEGMFTGLLSDRRVEVYEHVSALTSAHPDMLEVNFLPQDSTDPEILRIGSIRIMDIAGEQYAYTEMALPTPPNETHFYEAGDPHVAELAELAETAAQLALPGPESLQAMAKLL
jgi:hypothetical protein